MRIKDSTSSGFLTARKRFRRKKDLKESENKEMWRKTNIAKVFKHRDAYPIFYSVNQLNRGKEVMN